MLISQLKQIQVSSTIIYNTITNVRYNIDICTISIHIYVIYNIFISFLSFNIEKKVELIYYSTRLRFNIVAYKNVNLNINPVKCVMKDGYYIYI